MVVTPVAVIGLIGMPGAVPPGPAVLIGIVGAGMGAGGFAAPRLEVGGATGGLAIGAVAAAGTGRGALGTAVAAGTGVAAGASASGTVGGGVNGGTTAGTGMVGLGVAAGVKRIGVVSVGGKEAAGTAGGASEALSVTRTVSFFKGTLEVSLLAGVFSFSLMRSGFCIGRKKQFEPWLSNTHL
jgi:hypothetical protein